MNRFSFLKCSPPSEVTLYYYGNEFSSITGGWDLYDSAGKNADSLLFTCNSTVNGLFVTHNAIDLTRFSKLRIYSKKYPGLVDGGGLLISTNTGSIAAIQGGYVDAIFLANDQTNAGWAEMDVTIRNGLFYISPYAIYAGVTRGSYAYIVKLIP